VDEAIENLVPGTVPDSSVHIEILLKREDAVIGEQLPRICWDIPIFS
jgi:hypothetical protein